MRSLCLGFALALLLSHGAEGHQPAQAPSVAGGEPTATLLRGMGSHHHPVSTVSADAQKFFDQGLTLVYAFNHPEAVRSFERAAQLDPQMTMAYWGIALALGSNINSEIDSERERSAYEAVQKDMASAGGVSSESVRRVADHVVSARIAGAKGDAKTEIELLRKGVEREDSLGYAEPPAWYLPTRESLGGALLRNGQYAEAERVFRADLERNRRNGRSLFGLMGALTSQNRPDEAVLVRQEFEKAWRHADTPLRLADL